MQGDNVAISANHSGVNVNQILNENVEAKKCVPAYRRMYPAYIMW